MRPTTGLRRVCERSVGCLAGALLLVSIVFAPSAEGAKTDAELKQERAGVLAKKATAAAQVDALKADEAQVSRALDALQANVASQRQALGAAQAKAESARGAADAAREAEARAREVYASAEDGVRRSAVATYVDSGASSPVVNGNDIDAVARAKAYGAVVTGRRTDSVDALNAARKDLERAARASRAAAEKADRSLEAARQRLAALDSSLADQQRFADSVSARLDSTLSEAQSLATLDQALADEITRRETELAARLAAASPPRALAPAPTAPAGPGPTSSPSLPAATLPLRPPAPPVPGKPTTLNPAVPPVVFTGSGEIVTVRGIQVHRSIADNLARMLAAADGAGLSMSGGGYRSSESQLALRRANCSGDPYTAPASSCSPPTARPGQSMHEKGLAIDFTCGGSLIRSRSSPCFSWLKANGAGFGFFNLPSEPWHWSTNGN